MPDLDSMIAPRALLSTEIAEVAAPQLVVYGVAHRAFTHAYLWDGADRDRDHATTGAADDVLLGIAREAERSVGEWLEDVAHDGEPRFYQKAGLKKAVEALCSAAATIACKCESPAELELFIRKLEDRDPEFIAHVIGHAGEPIELAAPAPRASAGPAGVFLILSWDISDSRIEGPYDSAATAWSKIEDSRAGGDDEYLEQVTVLGPIREASKPDSITPAGGAR